MKHVSYKKDVHLVDVLKKTMNIFMSHFWLFALLALVIHIPLDGMAAFLQAKITDDTSFVFLLQMVGFSLAAGFVALLSFAMVVDAASLVYHKKKKLDFGAIFIRAVEKWPALIVTELISLIFIIGLFALLIVPGVIFMMYWVFALYHVILRNSIGVPALKASFKLVQNRWWKICGYTIVSLVIALVVSAILQLFMFTLSSQFAQEFVFSVVFSFTAGNFLIIFWTVVFLEFEKAYLPSKKA